MASNVGVVPMLSNSKPEMKLIASKVVSVKISL